MEFMPEYYSSNVSQPKPTKPPSLQNQTTTVLKPAKKNSHKSLPSSQTRVFYILKDDQFNSNFEESFQTQASLRSIGHANLADVKQNSIKNDLLLLLSQQPHKFQSFDLPDTFNCTDKPLGLHRDQFDCTKYYFCNSKTYYARQRSLQRSMLKKFYSNSHYESLMMADGDEFIQTKAYTCPENTVFNMRGCFCDLATNDQAKCTFLNETFCDFSQYRRAKN